MRSISTARAADNVLERIRLGPSRWVAGLECDVAVVEMVTSGDIAAATPRSREQIGAATPQEVSSPAHRCIRHRHWSSRAIAELSTRALTQPFLDGCMHLRIGPLRVLPAQSRSHHLLPEIEQVEGDAKVCRWCARGHAVSLGRLGPATTLRRPAHTPATAADAANTHPSTGAGRSQRQFRAS